MIFSRLLRKYGSPSALYGSALLIALLAGCRSSRSDQDTANTQPALTWQQTPLLIDGSDNDWVKPLSWNDPKEQLSWSVSNDRDNIYIMLTSRSQLEQQKIIGGGLTVWINPVAEKSDNGAMGISFPTDSRKSRDKSIMEAARPDLYKDKPTSLDDLTDYSLFGFNKDEAIETYPLGQPNNEGVQVKMGFNNSGDLVYEALIPIRSVFPGNGSPIAMRKSIGVGFVLEGLPPQPGMRGGGGSGIGVGVGGGIGMGSYGGSGIGLGLSFGGGGGRNNGKEQQLYKQTKIWLVLPLARPGPRSHA